MTSPTFGDKKSGLKPRRPDDLDRDLMAGAQPPLVGPLVCRLCKDIGQHVWVALANIAGTGFRAFPRCKDRDACRDRRESQGKEWPLVDASRPSFRVEEEFDGLGLRPG